MDLCVALQETRSPAFGSILGEPGQRMTGVRGSLFALGLSLVARYLLLCTPSGSPETNGHYASMWTDRPIVVLKES